MSDHSQDFSGSVRSNPHDSTSHRSLLGYRHEAAEQPGTLVPDRAGERSASSGFLIRVAP
ncbi:hypothetical protein MK805_07000 [Shimazuella sp. AN120528]|nr:hypothetical protein [Shimazuella soli]